MDTFVIYTDSETWAGDVHPAQALREYRAWSGIDARLVVVGMVSNGFSIADPADPGMLDVVGFDTATPQLISDFAASNPGAEVRLLSGALATPWPSGEARACKARSRQFDSARCLCLTRRS